MAMTLRLTEEETQALRETAGREGRSMHEVARTAITKYADREQRRREIDEAMDDLMIRYADTMRRLAE